MFFLVLTLSSGYWVETTQEDFRDGWFSRELYCSHRKGGAVEFVGRFDLNNDGYIDLAGDSWILWGASSKFDTENITEYVGNAGCDVADLDTDGHADYISTRFHSGMSLYWGAVDGPVPDEFQYLDAWTEGVYTTDLNKDGYLDILSSTDEDNAAVYWGSANGFSEDNVTKLPCDEASNHPEVADLNRDGWLDAIVIAEESGNRYIYWGKRQGFSAGNRTVVPFEPLAHGVSVADLNSDGWLDMVFTSRVADDGAILWGSEDLENSSTKELDLYLDLPGDGIGGSQISDLNNDGYLDILFYSSANVPNRIYWGINGDISRSVYSDLPTTMNIATGGLIADLDYDGHLDIFAYDRSNKTPQSKIFWGPSFTNNSIFKIHSHHGICREIGNVYTREYEEIYYSSVYDAQEAVRWGAVRWEDSCPGTSSIDLEIRTGNSPDTATWSSWIKVYNEELIKENMISRYVQYRAIFTYNNPSHLPVLFMVEVLPGGIIVRPDRNGAGFPGDTITYQLSVINYTELPDVIEMDSTCTGTGWYHYFGHTSVDPFFDTDNDSSPDVGELDAEGDSTGIIARVGIPANAAAGYKDTMTVYGYSSNVNGLYDSALVITRVLSEISITVSPDQDTTADRLGGNYDFVLTGRNFGRWSDIIDLRVRSNPDWNLELFDSTGSLPLSDNDGDGVIDLGELKARSGRRDFIARITVPANIIDPDTTYITGTSSNDLEVSDDAILVINPYTYISLEIISNQQGVVDPGDPAETYPLSVINHGNINQIGEISLRSTQGWSSTLLDSTGINILESSNQNSTPDVGIIERFGGTRSLFLEVRLPDDLHPGLFGLDPPGSPFCPVETTWVFVTASTESKPSDSVLIVTAALPVLDIHNYPNPFQGSTTFIYSVPVQGSVSLSLYNRAGELISTLLVDKHHSPGNYTLEWEAVVQGERLAPGVYLYVFSIKPEDGRKRKVVKKALLQP